MKLQFLVPQYKETDDIVRVLLDSIAMQRGVDFSEIGVIIMNDGSDVRLSEGLLRSYPFEIQYGLAKHAGVSAIRNALLKCATADYVMFCDADDAFCNTLGVWMLLREINGKGFDMLISRFMEECMHPLTGGMVYVSHGDDGTFVHGKVLRRQFLLDNDIRWDPHLTIHEDSYFNLLCKVLSEDTKYCDDAFYMWQWRADSVAREDPDYLRKTYPLLLESNASLVREFIRRERMQPAVELVAAAVTDLYYTMQESEWLAPENAAYRRAAEDKLLELWPEWEELFNAIDPAAFMEYSTLSRKRHISEGMGMEHQSMKEWMQEALHLDDTGITADQ